MGATVGLANPGCSPDVIGQERDAAVERSSFTFQPQRPLEGRAWTRWWYWTPLVTLIGVIVAAFLLGHTSSRQNYFSSSEIPAGPPAGETQVVDRSLGDGWAIRVFDNSSAGPNSPPQIAYELIEDHFGVTVRRGPLSFGSAPHLSAPGLTLMRGDPDADGPSWRWTTFYAVTDPSITAVRAVFDGQVVDSMRPVKLDDIRFVILTADKEAAKVHVEGLSRSGRVLASAPIADPTFGKAIP